MSRIVAGVAGGTVLFSVPGDGTRPTTDRVKEALFSRLEAMNMLAGVRVLDLFAGSGSLGVEAASRGAASVELVEFNEKAASVCSKNAELVNKALGAKVVGVARSKVESFLARAQASTAAPWDLVFMDPPYPLSQEELRAALELLATKLSPYAVVVVERSTRTAEPEWPSSLQRLAEKKYGETRLWFAEPAEAEQAESEQAVAAD